jgi:hypothetical protein
MLQFHPDETPVSFAQGDSICYLAQTKSAVLRYISNFEHSNHSDLNRIARVRTATHYTCMGREELYELVWSRPLTSVAADFGVSSVAIKKVCRRQQIPTPPRGYWAKVEAGARVSTIPLPEYIQPPHVPTAAERRAAEAAAAEAERELARQAAEQERLRQRRERERELLEKYRDVPLVCGIREVAKMLGIPKSRVRMLETLHRFPIRALPFYGRMRPFIREDGETDFEVQLVWSKFSVVTFILLPDDERQQALELFPRRISYVAPAYDHPQHEHHYVRYLKSRARWGHR